MLGRIIKRISKILKKILPKKAFQGLRSRFRIIQKFFVCRLWYPFLYRRGCRRPLNEKKVLFIETTASGLSSNYTLIKKRLDAQYDYEPVLFCLEKGTVGKYELNRRYAMLVKEAADAKYILLNDACIAFSHIKFRPGTKAVNVWHACGAFKKFGFGTADLKFGEDAENQRKYPNYTFLDEMYVSSPEIVDKYAFSTGLPEERIVPLGICRTDVFYDEEFTEAARERFRFLFPASEGKKVILYAPTFRGTVAKAKAPGALSVSMLQEALSDEYVMVIKEHPFIKKQIPLSKEEQDFAVNFSDVMTIEELICVADICISDYSSLVFEYSLFEKPMIFFAYDKHDYDDWRGFYYDYNELTPGPVFTKNSEIIDFILHVDERFCRQEVVDFKNKFMSACDGHVTDRIVERVFKDLAFRKEGEPAPDLVRRPAQESGTPQEEKSLYGPKEARDLLEQEYPLIKGKKIAAYVYSGREVASYPRVTQTISWLDVHEELPDDIALIYINRDKEGWHAPAFTSEVFFKKPEDLPVCDLLALADIIITNYDEEAAGYTGVKPVYYLIPELKWLFENRYDYEEQSMQLKEAGVLFEDTAELISRITADEGISE